MGKLNLKEDGYVKLLKEALIKIPIENRTESHHQMLIKCFGGARNYLLSMGRFKEEGEK